MYIEHAYSLSLRSIHTNAPRYRIITTYRIPSESRAGKMHTQVHIEHGSVEQEETKEKERKNENGKKRRMNVHVQRVYVCSCTYVVGAIQAAKLWKGLHETFVIRHSAVQRTIFVRLSNFVPIFALTSKCVGRFGIRMASCMCAGRGSWSIIHKLTSYIAHGYHRNRRRMEKNEQRAILNVKQNSPDSWLCVPLQPINLDFFFRDAIEYAIAY